jgi:TIR domain
MPSQSAAFMSYVRFNDQHDDGQLTQFRERLSAEVRAQTGEEFHIFQDRSDIAWGQAWQQRIDQALDAATLLVAIITPSFFRSAACRAEVERFLSRERELGRQDLILPVYYVSTPELDDPLLRDADELVRVVASRQIADWRELRFEPFTSPVVRRTVAQLAARMRDTFRHPPDDAPGVLGSQGRAAAGLQMIDRSTQPLDLMERPVFDTALLKDFVEAAGQVDASASPLLQRLARREIERVTRFMRQLPAGNEIVYDGEDREWLLGLTQEAQRSIDAISLATVDAGPRGFDGGLRTSDLGTRYLTLQREAMDRQVSIRRIFVFANEDLARDETFLKIVKMQRDVGVDVRLFHYQLIPEWLQTMTFDFIVFDGAVSYETTQSTTFYAGGSRPAIVRTLLDPMPTRVRDLENKFEQLWAAAGPKREIVA